MLASVFVCDIINATSRVRGRTKHGCVRIGIVMLSSILGGSDGIRWVQESYATIVQCRCTQPSLDAQAIFDIVRQHTDENLFESELVQCEVGVHS